jgi:hypothetical protein
MVNDRPDPPQRHTGNVSPIRPDAALHDLAERAWWQAFDLVLDRVGKGEHPGLVAEQVARAFVERAAGLLPRAATPEGRENVIGLITFAYSDLRFYADPDDDQ